MCPSLPSEVCLQKLRHMVQLHGSRHMLQTHGSSLSHISVFTYAMLKTLALASASP